MKILIHGNAPTASTGYGVQIAHLSRRLRDDGHEVAISCTFGHQLGVREWEGIRLYPSGWEGNGNDVIHNHALHWFDGDPLAGWILILTDLWVMQNPLLEGFNVVGWCPVDHFPAPPHVLAFFDRTGAVPVAMSRFGEWCLKGAGLDPTLIPLSIDPTVYKPTPTFDVGGEQITGRQLLDVPEGAFVVGMVAMNKDPDDRKGFNEALRAFGRFWRDHREAVLYIHADPNGMGTGLNLRRLADACAIPPHAIRYMDPYPLQLGGVPPEMMAAKYTAFDVLLAPSRGEGFCVPLIEAQACGTPVIASDGTAQAELIGSGWPVTVQPEWDRAQGASYVRAVIGGQEGSVLDCLEQAYNADLPGMAERAIRFAAMFDADLVYEQAWRPFLDSLKPSDPPALDRPPIPAYDAVAVVIPAMRRPQNVAPLVDSLKATPEATAYFVCDPDDTDQIKAVHDAGAQVIVSERGHTFPIKANVGYEQTTEPWIFLCGDDVEFTPGWLDAARPLSTRFDVIGTNDAADGRGNPTVQSGHHADHMLIRRAYIDAYGASLDGPGVLCCEEYHHFFVDWELVQLAKARGVFAPCLTSIVNHKHPGLGKGQADLVYQPITSDRSLEDKATFEARRPLIDMQRTGRGKA